MHCRYTSILSCHFLLQMAKVASSWSSSQPPGSLPTRLFLQPHGQLAYCPSFYDKGFGYREMKSLHLTHSPQHQTPLHNPLPISKPVWILSASSYFLHPSQGYSEGNPPPPSHTAALSDNSSASLPCTAPQHLPFQSSSKKPMWHNPLAPRLQAWRGYLF